MTNLQAVTLEQVQCFPTFLMKQTEQLFQLLDANIEAVEWHKVQLDRSYIDIPSIIYNEMIHKVKITACSNIVKQQYYCLFSRHNEWQTRLNCLKKLYEIDSLYNWAIPFLMLSTTDEHPAIRTLSRKILSTFDAREIERISYKNIQFIKAIRLNGMK